MDAGKLALFTASLQELLNNTMEQQEGDVGYVMVIFNREKGQKGAGVCSNCEGQHNVVSILRQMADQIERTEHEDN